MSTESAIADIIDVEGEEVDDQHPPAAIAHIEGPGAGAALFGTTDPVEVLTAARRAAEALVEVLEERQLYKQIGSKKHVYIEGWLMLAGMLQISTPNDWVREIIEDGQRVGWEARYEARAANGRLLSSAEGECRRMEEDRKRNGEVVRKWEHRAEHAIRSMAQTRAQSKALASALRWVVELGGFSGTPAEEMTDDGEAVKLLPCPACGKETVRDNRAAKKADPEGKERWPAFGCRNDACTGGNNGRSWATWDSHYYEPKVSPENEAKQRVLAIVEQHEDAWAEYYEPDAPGYTSEEQHLLHSIRESGDRAQKAGFLWNRLVDAYLRETGQPSQEDAEPGSRPAINWNIIVRAAEIALGQAAEDAADLILEDRAIEIAGEQLQDEQADADGGYSDYA